MGNSFDSVESVESYLSDPRWDNIKRDYDANGISSLRSPFQVVNTISEEGSKSLLNLLQRDDCWVSGLGAATTQQAVQMFNLSYEIIYISGRTNPLSYVHCLESFFMIIKTVKMAKIGQF